MSEADGELSAERRAELETRLEELHVELRGLARDRLRRPLGAPTSMQVRSEALEAEADVIRDELGMVPALGRSSRSSWMGWIILCVVLAAVVVGVWYLGG